MRKFFSLVALLLCSSIAVAQQPACKPGQPCWQGGTVTVTQASTSTTCTTCTTQAVRTTSATCRPVRVGLFGRLFGRCR